MLKRAILPAGILEATHDVWGRSVWLPEKAMRHISRRHPEMDGCDLAITTAIENATQRCLGRQPGREILYAPNLGPARWLAVVVAYSAGRGEVVTAYGHPKGPREADLI
jgi:hypothetical protein